jgi:hypothetical protein
MILLHVFLNFSFLLSSLSLFMVLFGPLGWASADIGLTMGKCILGIFVFGLACFQVQASHLPMFSV